MSEVCWPCAHIWDGRRHDQPAAYVWTCQNGNRISLCIECCSQWRAAVVLDGLPQAASIKQLLAIR